MQPCIMILLSKKQHNNFMARIIAGRTFFSLELNISDLMSIQVYGLVGHKWVTVLFTDVAPRLY